MPITLKSQEMMREVVRLGQGVGAYKARYGAIVKLARATEEHPTPSAIPIPAPAPPAPTTTAPLPPKLPPEPKYTEEQIRELQFPGPVQYVGLRVGRGGETRPGYIIPKSGRPPSRF